MSLLGHGGKLVFARPAREALLLTAGERRESSDTLHPSEHRLWTGDFVELCGDGEAPLSPYYETCFVHVDRLKRLSLYTTKHEAYAGERNSRMPIPEIGCFPLHLRPIDGDYDITTELGDWTLHTDSIYLNEALLERQLGSGALSLCACGGEMSFRYEATNPRAFARDVALLYNMLDTRQQLAATLEVSLDSIHKLAYCLTVNPLAYVLNYRDMPHVDGTLDFACSNPPQVRQI
jgi:hypothetical protein